MSNLAGLKEKVKNRIITLTDNGQQQQEAVFEAISSCLPQEFDTTEYDEMKYVFEELEQTLKHLIEK